MYEEGSNWRYLLAVLHKPHRAMWLVENGKQVAPIAPLLLIHNTLHHHSVLVCFTSCGEDCRTELCRCDRSKKEGRSSKHFHVAGGGRQASMTIRMQSDMTLGAHYMQGAGVAVPRCVSHLLCV